MLLPKHSNGNAWMQWLSFIFWFCSTVNTPCGKEILKQLIATEYSFIIIMYLLKIAWSHVFTYTTGQKPCAQMLFTYKFHYFQHVWDKLALAHVQTCGCVLFLVILSLSKAKGKWMSINGVKYRYRVLHPVSCLLPENSVGLFICHNAMNVSLCHLAGASLRPVVDQWQCQMPRLSLPVDQILAC